MGVASASSDDQMCCGTTEEIFPLILANTLGGCPVLKKEENK